MISRIHIALDKSEEETLQFLKSSAVTIKNQTLFGKTIESFASWKNLENPRNFKFVLESTFILKPWWGKCSIKQEPSGKTTLSILILPPIFFLVFAGLMLLSTICSFVVFAINNDGTHLILPPALGIIAIVGVFAIYSREVTKKLRRKIKTDILASFEAQMRSEDEE